MARRVSGSVGVPTSSIATSTPPGRIRRTCLGDLAAVDDRVVDADRLERAGPLGTAGGRDDREAAILGEDGRGHADRGGAAADQQRLPGLGVEADGERSVGGLEHLGDRAERRPVEVGAERDDLAGGDAGVLGVAAVERAAHPAHHRRDLPAGLELAPGSRDHGAGGLDAEHAREGDALGEPESRVQLGAVSPNALTRISTHPGAGSGIGSSRISRASGGPGAVEHRGAHGVGHRPQRYSHPLDTPRLDAVDQPMATRTVCCSVLMPWPRRARATTRARGRRRSAAGVRRASPRPARARRRRR